MFLQDFTLSNSVSNKAENKLVVLKLFNYSKVSNRRGCGIVAVVGQNIKT